MRVQPLFSLLGLIHNMRCVDQYKIFACEINFDKRHN